MTITGPHSSGYGAQTVSNLSHTESVWNWFIWSISAVWLLIVLINFARRTCTYQSFRVTHPQFLPLFRGSQKSSTEWKNETGVFYRWLAQFRRMLWFVYEVTEKSKVQPLFIGEIEGFPLFKTLSVSTRTQWQRHVLLQTVCWARNHVEKRASKKRT